MSFVKKIKNKIRYILSSQDEKRHGMVGPPSLWKMKREFQIDFLLNQGLKKSDNFLDIGCGTLRGGIPIIQFLDSEKYIGIDVRKSVIEEGVKEIIKHGLSDKKPHLFEFKKFSNLALNKFDKGLAFSVLIHLDDEILDECLEFVSKHIKRSGSFYANVNIDSWTDKKWKEFPIVARSLDFYTEVANKHNLYINEIGPLKELGHISGQKLGDQQIMLEFRLKSN